MNFVQFANLHGVVINRLVYGKITRCSTASHPGKKNGAFYFDTDFGWIQDWAQHAEIIVWKSDKVFSPDELARQKIRMDESRRIYIKDQERRQTTAALKAELILSQCHLDISQYLASKGFPDALGNVWARDDSYPVLVIPMHIKSALVGVQLIGHDGHKRFLPGQRCNDATFSIGDGENIFLVEGYASGLSLKAILDSLKIRYTIHVCFSAQNMARIAKAPKTAILICDNDESGTGQKVGAESGRRWWMPETCGMDINDLHKSIGTFKAAQILRKFLQNSNN